ncbi:MAG: NAD(P)/FAD-dependent oxidoreductase, partial [Anaerolineae bacterium]
MGHRAHHLSKTRSVAEAFSIPTIIIAGAGYGGLAAARMLGRHARAVHVIVIDQNPYHLLQYQLHEAAVGKIDAAALAVPLQSLLPKRVEFRQASIRGFDFKNRVIQTDRGDVVYDQLIIALGGQPATFNIPGLNDHALTLKSLKDALRINGHIEWTLASAAKLTDSDARSAALTFIVGGAGVTGVELAAELAEKLGERAREYGIDPRQVRIALLEAAPTVLPGFDPETIAEATGALKQLGVQVRTHSTVMRVDAGQVTLKNGETIRAGTFIWAGGVRANPLVLDSGLTIEGRGAAAVDYFLRSVDYPDVAIVGDSALVRDPRYGGVALPCAQLAVKEGQHAAKDIIAELKGDARRVYVPHLQGLLISLGGRRGVGTIGPVWVRRLIARLGKIGAETRYMWHIGGIRLLLARWLWLRAEWVR